MGRPKLGGVPMRCETAQLSPLYPAKQLHVQLPVVPAKAPPFWHVLPPGPAVQSPYVQVAFKFWPPYANCPAGLHVVTPP